jgi:hypothetical protein
LGSLLPEGFLKKVLDMCCEANKIFQRKPSRERGTKRAMPIVTLGSKLKMQTTLVGYGTGRTKQAFI